jgi:iron complex transport system substrate-binding protein
MPVTTTTRTLVALLLAGPLLLAGCASHSDTAAASSSTPASTGATFPTTVRLPGANPVTLTAQPHRIVSLDPSDTETLFAIGAGAQVVAVDKDSDYPANAPHSQLDATNPSVESIAKDNPDLVIATYDTNGLVAALGKLHIPVLLVNAPTDVNGAYGIWTALGAATGHPQQAAGLVSRTKKTISSILAATPRPATPLSYYYELDPTYYTVTSHTFIGSLLGQFGLTDIADSGGADAAGGYPQLSAEKVLDANPSLVVLADHDCCGQSANSVAGRPGWNLLGAIKDGAVIAPGDDISSRWGPRIVDLMRSVSTAIGKAAHGNG